MPPTRVTLAEVARRAGLSKAAASYALRNHPEVSAATRERVQRLAREMGYRPDPVMARLMTRLHAARGPRYAGKIAFINPSDDPAFAARVPVLGDFLQAATRRAAELGYDIEEFWLHEPGRSPRRLAQMLRARGIDGLLIGSSGAYHSEITFPFQRFAAVTVGYTIDRPPLHRVVTHHYRNTRLALSRVEAAGYRRIGFVADARHEAYMEHLHHAAYLQHQSALPAALRVPPLLLPGRDAEALRTLASWFARHRPDAVLSTDYGPETFAQAGLAVPRDLALARLILPRDDVRDAGILPGYDRLGVIAIELLAAQLGLEQLGPPEAPRVVQLEGEWRDGPSLPPVAG